MTPSKIRCMTFDARVGIIMGNSFSFLGHFISNRIYCVAGPLEEMRKKN